MRPNPVGQFVLFFSFLIGPWFGLNWPRVVLNLELNWGVIKELDMRFKK